MPYTANELNAHKERAAASNRVRQKRHTVKRKVLLAAAVDAAASQHLLASLVLHRARSRSFFEATRLAARHGGHAVV